MNEGVACLDANTVRSTGSEQVTLLFLWISAFAGQSVRSGVLDGSEVLIGDGVLVAPDATSVSMWVAQALRQVDRTEDEAGKLRRVRVAEAEQYAAIRSGSATVS
ncbi:MAG: hypothetical protein ACYCS4_07810 [Acidimicrobiales bacterium]